MSKTIKTVLAILGALTAICAVLLILKKKFGCLAGNPLHHHH